MPIESLSAGVGCPPGIVRAGEAAVVQGSYSFSIRNDTEATIEVRITGTLVDSQAVLNYTNEETRLLATDERWKASWENPAIGEFHELGQVQVQAFLFIRSDNSDFSDQVESTPCTFTVATNLEGSEQYQRSS